MGRQFHSFDFRCGEGFPGPGPGHLPKPGAQQQPDAFAYPDRLYDKAMPNVQIVYLLAVTPMPAGLDKHLPGVRVVLVQKDQPNSCFANIDPVFRGIDSITEAADSRARGGWGDSCRDLAGFQPDINP